MSRLNYNQVVREIESQGIMPEGPPSLEPMKSALNHLLPHLKIDPKNVVVVAGTNGKGSVSATLEALLLEAGVRVGLFTSPHLEETTERIRIQGKDISQELFCQAYQKIRDILKNKFLTHFETLTLMAVWVFFSGESVPPIEKAIFEVGLGGTWDATNAVPHQNCIITSIDYDHQNLLGSTLTEIAKNKFGIVSSFSKVVHSPLPEEILPLAKLIKSQTQSTWRESIPFQFQVEKDENQNPIFKLVTQWGNAHLTLPGLRGAQNTATALTAFHEFGYLPELNLSAISKVRWPGRMERVETSTCPCPTYLSGDHNPHGIKSLLELLPHYPRKHLRILVGIGRDKDYDQILDPLFSLENTTIYLTETPFRGRDLGSYGHWLGRASGAFRDPIEGFKQIALNSRPDDMILITGSLYLVGLLRKSLHDIRNS